MGAFDHYLKLIGDRDHEGIESARDGVTPEDVKLLADHYGKLEEDFDRFMDYYNDRELIRNDAARMLKARGHD